MTCKRSVLALLIMLTAVFLNSGVFAGSTGESKTQGDFTVSKGKKVKLHYTLMVDNEVADTSRKGTPIEFIAGAGQMIPGFAKSISGMKKGEKKSFLVAPEDAYGPVRQQAIVEVPRSNLPPEITPAVGMILQAGRPDGSSVPARIDEVKKDTIVMNFNHPLAGKTLSFEVEIMDINPGDSN